MRPEESQIAPTCSRRRRSRGSRSRPGRRGGWRHSIARLAPPSGRRSRPFVLLSAVAAAAGAVACRALPEPPAPAGREPVVYGSDDRQDYYSHPSELLRQLTRESVVALVRPERLVVDDPEDVRISAETLGDSEGLCDGERFAEQTVAASCSGTLVDADLVLTAGHCVESSEECHSRRFVFGYYLESEGALARITEEDIFECRERVVYRDSGGFDYAIVQLDRPVGSPRAAAPVTPGLAPLPEGEPLAVIGFGAGLPAKIDDGGEVIDGRADELDYFSATLDTFHRSSGSGVFDAEGRVVGVLVRGAADYVDDGGCSRVSVLSETDPPDGGEKATYASRAIEALCDSGWTSDLCGETDGWCRPCASADACPDGWACTSSAVDDGIRWCARPCDAAADCIAGHECGDGGLCEPSVATVCRGAEVWTRNLCGRFLARAEYCSPDRACADGACVAFGPGDDCGDPVSVRAGDRSLSGTLDARYDDDARGSCGGSGRDKVFRLLLDRRYRVEARVTGFDTVLYARAACARAESELACSDDVDPPHDRGSVISFEADEGEVWLFVDAYGEESGEFELRLSFESLVPAPADGGPEGGPDADVPADAGPLDGAAPPVDSGPPGDGATGETRPGGGGVSATGGLACAAAPAGPPRSGAAVVAALLALILRRGPGSLLKRRSRGRRRGGTAPSSRVGDRRAC